MSMAPIPNIVLGVIPALIFAVFIKKFPKQIYKAAMIYGFVILALIFIVFLNFKLGIIHGLNYLFLAPLFAPYPLGAIVQMFIKIFSKE